MLTPFAVLRKTGFPNIIAPVIVNGSPDPEIAAVDDVSSALTVRLCFVDRRDSEAPPS